MPKLDLEKIPQTNTSTYPPEFAGAVAGRWVRRLTTVAGLTDFGAAHVVLKPGAQSSQRHWHEGEDELVVVIAGEAVLVDDGGRTTMRPGDIAAFPMNDGNGHMLVNESDMDCTFVVIGRPPVADCHYPDIDLHLSADLGYHRKDGSLF